MKIKLLFSLLLLCSLSIVNAQSGKVTGVIYDKEFQEPLPFANVSIIGDSEGAASDFDGIYSLELAQGVYTLAFSFVGFQSITVEGVEIKSGETTELNIYLESAAEEFDEVVVTSQVLKNNEQSVLQVQKKSANLLDGLSAQNIKSTGVSDLANAMKSVPGVSVQGGKYVYVRGLGDRYTKTTINGIDIPGLDPDRNTIQLDIFPTNLIDQIIVLKSASAELPADFTGGIVDVVTKDIPSQQQFNVSLSVGYNPDMNFNSNFLVQEKSNTDFLGFDGGFRDAPFERTREIPNVSTRSAELSQLVEKFDNTFANSVDQSGMDLSFNLNYGNQFKLGKNTLGLITSVSYSNQFQHFDNFVGNIYRRYNDTSNNELRASQARQGISSENNVLLNGLFGLSFKTEKSKYKFNVLGIQNGISNSILIDEQRRFGADARFDQTGNFYTQKSLLNYLLSGVHYNGDGSLKVEWKASTTQNKNYDKDFRTSAFVTEDGYYDLDLTATGFPQRFWRILDENSTVGKIDLTKDYTLSGRKAKFKAGGYFSQKIRDYYIQNYTFNYKSLTPIPGIETGDPSIWLDRNNLYNSLTNQGTYFVNNSSLLDEFQASQNIIAGYISNEFEWIENLRSIIGLRYEIYTQDYDGYYRDPQTFQVTQIEERFIDQAQLYPSFNLIYKLNEESNLRLGYSKTVARPSFKELSNASIFDPLTTTFFFGNIDVQPSIIDNFDLRYERFFSNGDMMAFSSFYKGVDNPIEIVLYSPIVDDSYWAKNVDTANVYGVEFELRKKLIENLKLRTNASYIYSRVEMDEAEYQARLNNIRDGEDLDQFRNLQGQSPFLINTSLEYFNSKLRANLNYNVQGKALEIVGNGAIPDVYTMPFNSLNLNVIRYGGENNNIEFKFRVNNILNDTRRSEYISSGAQEKYYFRKLDLGTSFTIGVSYKL